MKNCPKCNTQVEDSAMFCSSCGTSFATSQQPTSYAAPVYDPFDHTAEFDSKDISDNKVVSMLVYLLGWIGIIIALLASNSSPYAAFHLRQGLKFIVVETLLPIVVGVGAVVCIVPILGWIVWGLAAIAAVVMYVVLFVIKIICFFQICSGKAKEPAIIRELKFLK